MKINSLTAYHFTLLESDLKNEPIVFMDSAHRTMATKVVYGWIRKCKDKLLVKTEAKYGLMS